MRRKEKLAWFAAFCVLTCAVGIRQHIFRKDCLDYMAKHAYKSPKPEVLPPDTVSFPAIDFCAVEHHAPLWMDAVVLGWLTTLIGTMYGFGLTVLSYLRDGRDEGAVLWRPHFFLIAGIVLTPIACLVGIISGAAGHGTYIAARLMLPYACAAIGMYPGAGILVCALALLQWPVYGFVIDKAKIRAVMAAVILLLHGIFCVSLFTFCSSNF